MNKAKLCWVATNPFDDSDVTLKWTDQDGSGEWFTGPDSSDEDYVLYEQFVLIPVD